MTCDFAPRRVLSFLRTGRTGDGTPSAPDRADARHDDAISEEIELVLRRVVCGATK
jgi:hypothetical protein